MNDEKIYSVENILGEKVLSGKLKGRITTVAIEDLLPGIYFIRIGNGGVLRFVKD